MSYKIITTAQGKTVYKVQVSAGRNRKITRNWHPKDGWSKKTTERELHKFEAQLQADLANGKILTRKEELEREKEAQAEALKLKTLRQYVDGVYMPSKEVHFSENAKTSYRQFLDRHILPTLGDLLLTDIASAMLSKLLLDFQRAGYAHASVIKLYTVLSSVFQSAFGDDSIQVNPMLKVARPKPRKDELEKEEGEKAYTAEELSYILRCLEQEPLQWRTYVWLLADTGIRRGEACGLQWADIDFDRKYIIIRHNLQYTPKAGVQLVTPKNRRTRIVDVGSTVLSLLKELQREQDGSNPFVFTARYGQGPMNPQSPTRYFKKLEAKYQIRDFHPHKLRHTSASLALTNGADVVSVSERLGHSDASVTLKMYAHANEDSIRQAGQTVRNLLEKQE